MDPDLVRQQGSDSPQKVLLLASYAPSLINFRGPLIRELRRRGHRVLAAAPEMDADTEQQLRALGAEPLTLRLSNASLNPLSLLASIRELRGLLRRHRPDLILSYTIKPVIVGALAGHAEGVPKVASLITGVGFAFTDGGGPRRRLVRRVAALLYRAALRRSHVTIFQNRDDEALFRDFGLVPEDAQVAVVDGSGVDLDHFAPRPLPRAPSFLMIARLLRDKGIHEYAEAAMRLKREHPDVAVGLVGHLFPSPNSISQRELDALAARGLHCYGKLEDVRPAIADHSVYVLPSYREGTPRSVLEAMAMGRPVITTDVPGCRETVADGVNGFLVPARDAQAIYEAMKRFVDRPELIEKMGAESRRIAERRYDARKVSADMLRHLGLARD